MLVSSWKAGPYTSWAHWRRDQASPCLHFWGTEAKYDTATADQLGYWSGSLWRSFLTSYIPLPSSASEVNQRRKSSWLSQRAQIIIFCKWQGSKFVKPDRRTHRRTLQMNRRYQRICNFSSLSLSRDQLHATSADFCIHINIPIFLYEVFHL